MPFPGLDFDDLSPDKLLNIPDLIGEGAYEIGGGPFQYGQQRLEAGIQALFRVPVPLSDLTDALDLFEEYLGYIPLDGLRQFRGLLPGVTDADFVDVPTSVSTIISNLTDKPLTEILIGLVMEAITGIPDTSRELLGTFFGNFRDFINLDFADGGFDVNTARQSFADVVVAPFLAGLSGVDQALRDALTGIADSTDTDIDNWVVDLLNTSSPLDAANITNIANIPQIGQDRVTGLVGSLADKLGIGDPLDAADLTNLANFPTIGQDKISGLITDLGDKLGVSDPLDASNLTNLTNIPEIAIGKVTGLASSLSDKLDGSSPLDVTNLTGVIDFINLPELIPTIDYIRPDWLASVPLSSLTTEPQNLFWDGGFDDPSFENETDFTHDTTMGETTPLGSAKIDFDGADHVIFSNKIPAEEGDEFAHSAKTYWSGVTAYAPMFRIVTRAFNASDVQVATATGTDVGAGGTASGWTEMAVDLTCPANTKYVTVELWALSTASAGSGWLDNAWATRAVGAGTGILQTLLDRTQNLGVDGILSGEFIQGVTTDIKTEVQQLFQDTIENFLGIDPADVPSDPTNPDVKLGLKNVWDLITDHAVQISTTQARVDALAGTGNSLSVDFSNFPDNQPMPAADYDVIVTGGGSGNWGTRNGASGWYGSLSGTRRAQARVKTVRPNDDYVILRATLKDLPQNASPDAKMHGVCRLDSTWQNYVFARGYNVGWYQFRGDLGFVLNGVEYVWKTVSLNWNTTMTMYFGYQGNKRRYLVYSGNTLVLDFDENNSGDNPHYGTFSLDPAAQGTPSNHRYFGMLAEMYGGKHSGSLGAFSMSEQ